MPLPSLSSIHAFEAAARLGGFAKAAAELGTTPAAVSWHVRQLERQVGLPLFQRHAQKVVLTAEGAVIAAEVTGVFTSLRDIFARAADTHQQRLSLTTLPTLGTSWLVPRLGGFRTAHDDIQVELDLSDKALDLGDGRFDAAIRNGHGKWPGLRAVKLFPSLFMPLCCPALADGVRGIGDAGRALDVPLLGRPDWWQLWYAALGQGEVDLSGRFGTRFQAEYLDAAAAIAGHGVTIGSPLLLGDEIKAGRLVPAHAQVAGDGRHFWLTFPAMQEKSRKIRLFRDWVLAAAEGTRREMANLVPALTQ